MRDTQNTVPLQIPMCQFKTSSRSLSPWQGRGRTCLILFIMVVWIRDVPPKAHAFDHLAPSGWRWYSRLARGNTSQWVGFDNSWPHLTFSSISLLHSYGSPLWLLAAMPPLTYELSLSMELETQINSYFCKLPWPRHFITVTEK